eukprot:scaffold428044_cov41-Prasinocladus_malaysianus.AAC.1
MPMSCHAMPCQTCPISSYHIIHHIDPIASHYIASHNHAVFISEMIGGSHTCSEPRKSSGSSPQDH